MTIHIDLWTVCVGAAASVYASFLITGLFEWLRKCDPADSEELCALEKSDGRQKVMLAIILLAITAIAISAKRLGLGSVSSSAKPDTVEMQGAKGASRLQGGQALALFFVPRLVNAALPRISKALWPRVRAALPRSIRDALPASFTAARPRRASPSGNESPRAKSARAPRSEQSWDQTPCS